MLVRIVENDAFLSLQLMFKLQVLFNSLRALPPFLL